MPAAHEDVLVQALQTVEIEVAVRPAVSQSREQRLLIVVMRGESAPDGGDLQDSKALRSQEGESLAQSLPAATAADRPPQRRRRAAGRRACRAPTRRRPSTTRGPAAGRRTRPR